MWLQQLFTSNATHFFPADEEERMVEAIRFAEQKTSGEIRLFVESHCKFLDPVDRAIEVFGELRMQETKDRNGVLLYIAMKGHQLAIYGDKGIHERLGQDFWTSEIRTILAEFGQQHYADGIIKVIHDIGEALKTHFPFERGDSNELKDDIVFGK